ncbi:MAG: glycine cleavage system aminomethyltransferase GcvT [Candidatus Methanomethylicota archaeon]|uniref:Probable aminomethyltransferase n=1 Tax=Thermoproteota archaeon TaxID=2056631 RepID=A0A497F039_9CREN|nr:MAG: glycine cleavage system aminomethyltransferase GcvT [Candidatus Verstraetearchaeota archaeon]
MATPTHLLKLYKAMGAHVAEYAGWLTPLWFEGVMSEHLAVRESVGLFDVSHMGRFLITGDDSARFLDYVTTMDVLNMGYNAARYGYILNEKGGIKDDVIVYRVDKSKFRLVCNAVNRGKIFKWLIERAREFADVKVEDVTFSSVMLAVQGPKAEKVLQKICKDDLSSIGWYKHIETEIGEQRCYLSRTGYTGEDGFEIILLKTPSEICEAGEKLWTAIYEAGKEFGLKPCGLGARDSLRIEAGLPLYGNELSEDITPLEVRGYAFIKFEKGDFIGKKALLEIDRKGLEKVRIGVKMVEQGIPRSGFKILKDDVEIGWVSSGTYSPLIRNGIGLGFVKTRYAVFDSPVFVNIRGRNVKARLCNWPFYDTLKYGRLRASK